MWALLTTRSQSLSWWGGVPAQVISFRTARTAPKFAGEQAGVRDATLLRGRRAHGCAGSAATSLLLSRAHAHARGASANRASGRWRPAVLSLLRQSVALAGP